MVEPLPTSGGLRESFQRFGVSSNRFSLLRSVVSGCGCGLKRLVVRVEAGTGGKLPVSVLVRVAGCGPWLYRINFKRGVAVPRGLVVGKNYKRL